MKSETITSAKAFNTQPNNAVSTQRKNFEDFNFFKYSVAGDRNHAYFMLFCLRDVYHLNNDR